MEEFRSTEILDKEIKEDARKKAEKILKNANEEIERIKNSIPIRLEKTKEEELLLFEKKINLYRTDSNSGIPLEKKRKRIAFINLELNNALDNYFHNLDNNKKIKIISDLLIKFKPIVENKIIDIKFTGFKKNEIEDIIKKIFLRTTVKNYIEFTKTEAHILDIENAIFLYDINKEFICRGSLNEIKKNLLDEQRNELMATLFE